MEYYNYGMTTPEGIYIDMNIQYSISGLYYLCTSLEGHGRKIESFNTEGVVIGIISYIEPPLPPSVPVTDPFIYTLDAKLDELANEIMKVKEKTMIPVPVPEMHKEITDSFFILFDFLPEHIKSELKIYIKKK